VRRECVRHLDGILKDAEVREQVLRRDRWRCQFCGTSQRLEVHHQTFRSHGGSDTPENLVTLCMLSVTVLCIAPNLRLNLAFHACILKKAAAHLMHSPVQKSTIEPVGALSVSLVQ
jgi:hypothetical protein